MRAVVFSGIDRPADVRDVELAAPHRGEVRVRIAAAGVCHSDLHVLHGSWHVPVPTVMGHEGSGVVVEVGEGVENLSIGDHVVLSWVPSCGSCRNCRRGRESRCTTVAEIVAPKGVLFDGTSRLTIDGSTAHHYLGVSSFAEEVVVPASGAIRIREDAPLDVVAIVGCAVATGIGAVMNTARVDSGATVAVVGCGGVGLNVVQGARLAGAERIIGIDVQRSKVEAALALGATDSIVVGEGSVVGDDVRALLPEGVDYAFDAIGKVSTTEQAVSMLALGGSAVIVGLPPAGSSARFDPLVLAEADQRILGCNYGSVRPAIDIPRFVDMYMAGDVQLDPLISRRRPLHEVNAALDDLANGAVLRTLLIP